MKTGFVLLHGQWTRKHELSLELHWSCKADARSHRLYRFWPCQQRSQRVPASACIHLLSHLHAVDDSIHSQTFFEHRTHSFIHRPSKLGTFLQLQTRGSTVRHATDMLMQCVPLTPGFPVHVLLLRPVALIPVQVVAAVMIDARLDIYTCSC